MGVTKVVHLSPAVSWSLFSCVCILWLTNTTLSLMLSSFRQFLATAKCPKCQIVCEKGKGWKTCWLRRSDSSLIAGWVHQVCASDSFSRAFVLKMGLSFCLLHHRLCKPVWKRSWAYRLLDTRLSLLHFQSLGRTSRRFLNAGLWLSYTRQ